LEGEEFEDTQNKEKSSSFDLYAPCKFLKMMFTKYDPSIVAALGVVYFN